MIAVLGTGSMGSAIAEGLLSAGWDVTVWNRTPHKVLSLVEMGAKPAYSAADALRTSELAIVALPDAPTVRLVLLSDVCAAALPGHDLLNVSYTTVDEIHQLASEINARGATLSEVNVTVYPDPVRRRMGHFNLAAAPAKRDVWTRVLGDLGDHVHDVGEVGNASKAEMALWLSYMLTPIAIAYAAAAFDKLDLPMEALLSALTENPTLRAAGAEDLLPQMLTSEYRADTYAVRNFRSSAEVVMAEAATLGLPTMLFEPVRELFVKAEALGFADLDVSAVYEALRTHTTPRGPRP